MEEKHYSVSELTAKIKGLLETPDFRRIFVEGEISGWKVYSSGHAYFTLKDEGAVLSCVMFASSLARCRAAPALRDGAKACVWGEISVYGARGTYQLVVRAAKIAGEGDLMARYLELKKKLEEEGLFNPAKRRRLPFLPRRIGIVTSPTGAVIHDMATVITRRCPGVRIRLYPVKVQGEGAAAEIVAGIAYFDQSDFAPDVVIVGRGGGSIEDLWAFNEEAVVRAVAASRAPVVSAVGHETDFTLCDFAADVRAGTPSIAAELVVPVKAELAAAVDDFAARLERAPRRYAETAAQRVDFLEQRLAHAPRRSCEAALRRLDVLEARAQAAAKAADAQARARLDNAETRLRLLDPTRVLARGYSITCDAQGRPVRRAADAAAGATLTTRLAEGTVRSVVCGG